MPNVIVSAYVPVEHVEAIDEAVKNGEYKNMSDFIRKAIRVLLEEK